MGNNRFLRRKTLRTGKVRFGGFVAGTELSSRVNWGDWIKSQPAPVFKPGHRLDRLSLYIYGAQQEYGLSLDLCERWGYGLNTGYAIDIDNHIADAQTANPTTDQGRLLKLAIQNPTKYPINAAIAQPYGAKGGHIVGGYLQDSAGTIIGGWSPEATTQAMLDAITFKLSPIVKLKALGVSFATVYDGGEEGIEVPGANAANSFGLDPKVLAAKNASGLDWVDYISKKKGQQLRQVRAAVKNVIPNPVTYLYYSNGVNAYLNIPDSRLYGFNASETWDSGDIPAGSVYYKDAFANAAGMGNTGIRDRAYYDQLTHWMCCVSQQILEYNNPISNSFVSAGQGVNILSIKSYLGFLKCMYASGSKSLVASYFVSDSYMYAPNYTPYNPASVPHWLLQQQATGEVHARFSWLDEYILDGDLLPGDKKGVIRTDLPAFEFTAYTLLDGFYKAAPSIRCLVRKLKTSNKWLVVLWSVEKVDSSPGDDTTVSIISIPGVEPLRFNARGQGSVYIVDKTGANTLITFEDEV